MTRDQHALLVELFEVLGVQFRPFPLSGEEAPELLDNCDDRTAGRFFRPGPFADFLRTKDPALIADALNALERLSGGDEEHSAIDYDASTW